MKKTFLLIAASTLLIAANVFAQVPPASNPPAPQQPAAGYAPAPLPHHPAPHHHRHHHHGHLHGNLYERCRAAGIILSDRQVQDINSINYDYEGRIMELEYQKRSIDYKFEYEKAKLDLNLNVIKDLINQRKDKEKEIDYLRIEKDVSLLNVLTAEQKNILNYYGARY